MLYSKFPPNKPVTQRVMHDNGVGAVIAVSYRKLEQDKREQINTQLQQAKGLPIHAHAIFHRWLGGKASDLSGKMIDEALKIIAWYPDIEDWTLVNELMFDQALWKPTDKYPNGEIPELYRTIAETFPAKRLWIGGYAVRRASSRNQILDKLRLLQKTCPSLHGFITVDYRDLSQDPRGTKHAGFVVLAKMATIIPRMTYLNHWFGQLKDIGIRPALETTVFADEDTPLVRQCQQMVLNSMMRLCDRYQGNLWWWESCQESAKFFEKDQEERQVYTGIWDGQGEQRLILPTKNRP